MDPGDLPFGGGDPGAGLDGAAPGGHLEESGEIVGLLGHLFREVRQRGLELRPLREQPTNGGFPFPGQSVPFVGEAIAVIGPAVALVGAAAAVIGAPLLVIERGLALDRDAVPAFGRRLTVIGSAVALIGCGVALTRPPVTLIGRGIPPIGDAIPVLGGHDPMIAPGRLSVPRRPFSADG
ncbi:MAG TPA: hypothetical protein VHL53_00550 [Acidimicrobiia bacterium]|nr:hypothetical protein [Acidimicrobiia bacterium]